jgi:flagellar basal-body rod protein FlgB
MLDSLSGQLDQYMTLLSTRQKLVASNIANADTPGYKTQDIDFEAELQRALANPRQTGHLSPVVTDVPGLRVKNDANNVDLDREARLLAENALRFSVASNLLRSQIKGVRMAIQGGGTAA